MRWRALLLIVFFLSCDAMEHRATAAMATAQIYASVTVVDSSLHGARPPHPSQSGTDALPNPNGKAQPVMSNAGDGASQASSGFGWTSDAPSASK